MKEQFPVMIKGENEGLKGKEMDTPLIWYTKDESTAEFLHKVSSKHLGMWAVTQKRNLSWD